MLKEHKKLYKAGKNWVTATISVAAFTLLGGMSAHKVQADTVDSQVSQETMVNQNQQTASDNTVALSQSESVQNNETQDEHQAQTEQLRNANKLVNGGKAADSNLKTEDSQNNLDNAQAVNEFKEVTRTIQNEYFPDIKQKVLFTRSVTKNKNGRLVYGNWKIADGYKPVWPAVTLPQINGLYINGDGVVKNNIIPEKQVTANTQDECLRISYRGGGMWGESPSSVHYPDGLDIKEGIQIAYRKFIITSPDNSKSIFIQEAPQLIDGLYDKNGKLVGQRYDIPKSNVSYDWEKFSIPQINGYKSFVHSYVNENGVEIQGQFATKITPSNFYRDGFGRSKILNVNIKISYVKDDKTNSSMQQGKSVVRKIVIINPDGKQSSNDQTVYFIRSVKDDDAGGYIYGNWYIDKNSPKLWGSFKIPQLNGYNSYANGQLTTTLPEVKVDNGVGSTVVIITYSKQPVLTKSGLITYIDSTGKIVKKDNLTGKVGEKIGIKLSLPAGYELANKDEQIPSTVMVTEDGIKTITVHVKQIPTAKVGSITYVDLSGNTIKTDKITGKVGEKVSVKLDLPAGYELANKDEQIPGTITVTKDGIKPITIQVKRLNTKLADNEVPYDTTTIYNRVNANYGYLDGYRLTESNQGQAQIMASGWHVTGNSNNDRYRYMIVYDNTLGREIARRKLTPLTRADVQRAYPNVNNSRYSGFNITIDIPNNCIGHSLSLISRYSNNSTTGEGANVDCWFSPLAINESNQANLDGVKVVGNTLSVNGWHATNQAAGRPYHYIIIWDRNLGHEIARQKVKPVSRPDVANVYNTIANAVNSGFSVNFDLMPQFFNDNIQFISRWTNDVNGNGNAVDYWFKPVNRQNRANLDFVGLSNGQLRVSGWHATDLSQLEPNHYLIVFDNTTGQQVVAEKVGLQPSLDVKKVYEDIQTANHARFNYVFNFLHLVPGHQYSLVSRYSVDSNGNVNDGAHTDYWLNMGTFQQSAYSIDHVALNRRHMTVQGWVANDNAMTRPYAYAILLQNGHEIGRQRLDLGERTDVAKVYPQIYRSQYSGFSTSFDLPTASTNGLQLVLRFTDDPAGNGNSSDKWVNL